MSGLLAVGLPAAAQEPEFEVEPEGGPLPRKEPSFFHRPAQEDPAAQLAHAEQLLAAGAVKEAREQFRALVHQWHDSVEAPAAQLAYARILEDQERYEKAFEEYQYLIDHYTGRFPAGLRYEDVLERQFRIANLLRTTPRKGWLGGGRLPAGRLLPLYERLAENAPRWDRAAEVVFTIGLLHEDEKDFGEAIKAYETVIQAYPQSEYRADAAFRRAHSLYRLAQAASRDETAARDALSALSAFCRDYPEHDNALQARRELDALKERLAQTYLEAALFYERSDKKKAALIAYRELVRAFPGTQAAQEATARIKTLAPQLEDKESRP